MAKNPCPGDLFCCHIRNYCSSDLSAFYQALTSKGQITPFDLKLSIYTRLSPGGFHYPKVQAARDKTLFFNDFQFM